LHEAINVWSVSGTVLILGFMLVVGHLKMKEADTYLHDTVAGETEEAALLYSAERGIIPVEAEEP
jgi:hypothetical protein